jgi:hypothetical protein
MRKNFASRASITMAVAGVGLSVALTAAAQAPPRPLPMPDAEAIIYRDMNFRGPAVNVSQAQPNLDLRFQIRAIRLVKGEWEVCTRPNYNGNCARVTRSYANTSSLGVGHVIQSMRPVSGLPPVGDFGPSLRGMASEFYPQPSINGRRVLACRAAGSSMACAQQGATEFCQARGYNYVGNVSLETVERRVVLADVLCRRSLG